MNTPFKIIPQLSGYEASFEAVFELPGDGVSPNQIAFQVHLESMDAQTCTVSIIGRTYRDTCIGSFDTSVKNLANILYGFARIETRQFLKIGGGS